MYYLAFPEDRPLNKILVYMMVFTFLRPCKRSCCYTTASLSTTFVVLSRHMSYQSQTALCCGLLYPCWEELVCFQKWILLSSVTHYINKVAFIVQSFYAYRLRILARSWAIVIFIVFVRFYCHRQDLKFFSTQSVGSPPINCNSRRRKCAIRGSSSIPCHRTCPGKTNYEINVPNVLLVTISAGMGLI
jgi:hypothetical protein